MDIIGKTLDDYLIVTMSKDEYSFFSTSQITNEIKIEASEYNEYGLCALLEAIFGGRLSFLHIIERDMDMIFRSRMTIAMAYLGKTERKVVELFYGCLNGEPMTMDEIGKELKTPKKSVIKSKNSALKKLRHPRISRGLREFVEYGEEPFRITPVAAEDACASASDGDSEDRVPAEHDG